MRILILLMIVVLQNVSYAQEREVLYWVAPMDANFRKDSPGKSPMGMDLVPVYADEVDNGPGIKVSPEVIQNLGVRTKKVEISNLWRAIYTVGTVVANPNKQQTVQIHTQGWVKELYVNEVGVEVKKGDVLFRLQSHELVNAQEDYLQILKMDNKKLSASAKTRLLNLGMNSENIKRLNKSRKAFDFIEILAPQNGIVSSISLSKGDFIKPSNKTISIVDLSGVWIKADVVENKSNWLEVNQPVDIKLNSNETMESFVDYIYPILNSQNRTVSVRMVLDNKDGQLKPNMFADLTIYAGAKENILVIPNQAVIRSGNSNRVMVAIGEGRFESKTVRIGLESGDYIEIVSGLKQGDEVVVSGQFLLDSEASLKASITRMGDNND